MKNTRYLFLFLLLSFFLIQCKEEEDFTIDNPYKDWSYNYPEDNDSLINAHPNSFAGIYQNIFQPTCANSGCHDGNFEPDFRTLQSTYNSLINKRVIKIDSAGLYSYRVIPGNADQSMLIIRMIEDLNGNSGIMPLSIDPGSDWHTKKNEHIQAIKNWINDGAKDVFGNALKPVDIPPILKGFAVTRAGETIPLNRSGNRFSAVAIPSNVNEIDIWFSIEDDNTMLQDLTGNYVKYSINLPFIDDAPNQNLNIVSNGPIFLGLDNQPIKFTHKLTLVKNDIGNSKDVIWFKAFVGDGINPISEIPSNSSLFQLKTYCAIRIL